MSAPNMISPDKLVRLVGTPAAPVIVDVREPHEFDICRIPNSILIPLGQIPTRLNELDKNAEIVVHCKMGSRSARAADHMRKAGFKNVLNLTGGILRWADKVDPKMPKY